MGRGSGTIEKAIPIRGTKQSNDYRPNLRSRKGRMYHVTWPGNPILREGLRPGFYDVVFLYKDFKTAVYEIQAGQNNGSSQRHPDDPLLLLNKETCPVIYEVDVRGLELEPDPGHPEAVYHERSIPPERIRLTDIDLGRLLKTARGERIAPGQYQGVERIEEDQEEAVASWHQDLEWRRSAPGRYETFNRRFRIVKQSALAADEPNESPEMDGWLFYEKDKFVDSYETLREARAATKERCCVICRGSLG